MREMDDTYHSKTDNIDTQRLYLKVNLRVVLAVYPRDMTVTQQLHNKPNTNKLLANLPPPRWISATPPLILQGLCNTLLTKREAVTRRFFKTMAAITRLTIEGVPDADPHTSPFYLSTCSSTPPPT